MFKAVGKLAIQSRGGSKVTVGNNVFIGAYSIILPGTVIGNNCIIGAGSLVRGTIPDNSVAAGVPARVIKTVAEYRAKALQSAVHIRGLSREEKRRVLCEKFGLE